MKPQSFRRPRISPSSSHMPRQREMGDGVGNGKEVSNIIRTRIKRLGLDYFLLHHGPERPIRSKAEILGRRIISECIIEVRRQEWEDEGGSGVITARRGTAAGSVTVKPETERHCAAAFVWIQSIGETIGPIWKRDRPMTDSNYLLSTRLIIERNFRASTFQRKRMARCQTLTHGTGYAVLFLKE